MRKVAREVAFKLIYEYMFNCEIADLSAIEIVETSKLDENDMLYLTAVYHGVIEEMTKLKEKISACTEGYKLERVYKIDLSLLLLAAYEICFVSDVPTAVAINEAVEMSKIYSTKKSGAFINGVLGKFASNEATKKMEQSE